MASLLGPPELHKTAPKPSQSQPQQPSADRFIDLMVADFNKTTVAAMPPMGFTENGVRGTGKSDKEGFYTAALWLHSLHPKTLACNVASFAEFGYFKDLPEIIYRLLEGLDVRKLQKAEWMQRKRSRRRKSHEQRGYRVRSKGGRKQRRKGRKQSLLPIDTRIKNAEARNQIVKEKASKLRKEKRFGMAKKVVERYSLDPDFRFLYDRVSDHFAECLKNDMKFYETGEFRKVSLAAKWCPSIDSSFDRSTLICESIARKVFPRESYPEYEGIEEAHYAYRVRDRLRKQVLVPLRKVLELPEVYVGANRWDLIPYNRVASVAMKFYKEKFLKHDQERFSKYLEAVQSGKAKIAAGALLPHEIIASLGDADGGQLAELQWKRMVDDLMKNGKLRNCLAVSDVSGSMTGIPMEVSVALGILVSELSEEPWKGKIITFSANPQLQIVEGDDLKSKTDFVRNMDWGRNTNFQKVFDLILQVAVNGKLKPEQMIKKLFVFSDMEFDRAGNNPWETDYQVIVRKYTEKGYGSVLPEIVFWNLRDSRATPVAATQKGVALSWLVALGEEFCQTGGGRVGYGKVGNDGESSATK
ncbi:hypothetical protein Pint_23793 [Pistacia integerrima]|uniref:Uncharacterized protein n=1 Tax=Pistacia integerrima TaxID=434235 RepID=A0ACC0YN49_9ROSI|nr:hypothetical protein Pint_23793 [Pistacia integerrima]